MVCDLLNGKGLRSRLVQDVANEAARKKIGAGENGGMVKSIRSPDKSLCAPHRRPCRPARGKTKLAGARTNLDGNSTTPVMAKLFPGLD